MSAPTPVNPFASAEQARSPGRLHRGVYLPSLLGTACLLAACATSPSAEPGLELIRQGKVREGLTALEAASAAAPRDAQLRTQALQQRWDLVTDRLQRAQILQEQGEWRAAGALVDDALRLAPGDERALAARTSWLKGQQLQPTYERLRTALDAQDLPAAERLLAELRAHEAPAAALQRWARETEGLRAVVQLRQTQAEAASPLQRRVSLQVQDAGVRATLETVARGVGVNIVFDREVKRDLRVSLSVQDVPLVDLIDLVLLQSQLARRTVNANSLFVYPATEARLREFQELDVRSFHVAYGDVKSVATALRTLLKLRDVVVDERSSTLVLRESPQVLAVAERIVRAHDRVEPEVMLELEVLEVSRDQLRNLGVRLPDSVGISLPGGSGAGGATNIADLRALTRDQLLVTPLSAGINLRVSDTDANLLASPRIRARHRQPARVMIGDKVPVITNSVTPLQSGNAVVTGAIQYLDVGIKLQVEPEVYPDAHVGIKLNLEVSNIAREIAGPGGSLAYQIGTRNAETVLRLRDGETQILAGLISDQVRSTAARIPGVGQLPLLGRLFSSTNGNDVKTEIVLSITPRIVRPVVPLSPALEQFASGTETQVRPRTLSLEGKGEPAPLLPAGPSPRLGTPPAPGAAAGVGASGASGVVPDIGAGTASPAGGTPQALPPGAAGQESAAAPEATAIRRSRPPQIVELPR